MNEGELLKLAEQEILCEAKKAAVRYTTAGPSGWKPCPLRKTNKTFLTNTILQAVASNRIRDRRKDEPKKLRKERKFLKPSKIRGPNKDNIIFKKPTVNNKITDNLKEKSSNQVKTIITQRNNQEKRCVIEFKR